MFVQNWGKGKHTSGAFSPSLIDVPRSHLRETDRGQRSTRGDNGAESVAGGTRMFEISGTSEVAFATGNQGGFGGFLFLQTSRYLGASKGGRKTN